MVVVLKDNSKVERSFKPLHIAIAKTGKLYTHEARTHFIVSIRLAKVYMFRQNGNVRVPRGIGNTDFSLKLLCQEKVGRHKRIACPRPKFDHAGF